MGDTVPREMDLTVDLESGGTTSEEDGPRDTFPGITKSKKLFGRVWNGSGNLDVSVKGDGALNSANYGELNSADASVEILGLLAEKKLGGEENVGKDVKRENPRKKSNKKAPKPPRPPKSPSLDAADMKLVKEISELAMLKRARIERMKALKKMKAAKAASSTSSSISNLCAMVITILFCVIIILQGILLLKFAWAPTFLLMNHNLCNTLLSIIPDFESLCLSGICISVFYL